MPQPTQIAFVFDPAFREAFENVQHRLFGLELKPYSLWHRLCLEMMNSPVLTGAPVSAMDLYAVARVCQSSFGPIPSFRGAAGWFGRLLLRFRFRRYSLPQELGRLQEYIGDFESGPLFWPDEGGSVKTPKCAEMDQLLELAAHVIRETGWSQETIWNMPIGQVRWYSAAFLKLEGRDVPFWTPQDEASHKAHVEKREKKLAGRAQDLAKAEGIPLVEARKKVDAAYWADVEKAKTITKLNEKLRGQSHG